jgi:hypothetical protein
MSYSHGYSKEDHARLIKLMDWIKNNVRQLNAENIQTLEKDLPTTMFGLTLDLKAGVAGKRKYNSGSKYDSNESSDGSDDEERRTLHDSIRTQYTHMAPSNQLFGRMEIPAGRTEDEYPPGYFDPFIDCMELPTSMSFPQYFDHNYREAIEPFSGDPSNLGVAFPVFFEKF